MGGDAGLAGGKLDRPDLYVVARFLDRLWAGVEERPFLAPLAILEHRDLEIGDIPYFATRPGTRDLWTSAGDRIPDFFPETGLDVLLHEGAVLGCICQVGVEEPRAVEPRGNHERSAIGAEGGMKR
mgnify:CR=1 FL=1